MQLQILALSGSGPEWADAATRDYLKRLPRHWKTEQKLITPVRRRGNATAEHWQSLDSDLARKAIGHKPLVALDERGRQYDSKAFAQRIDHWQEHHQQLCLLLGGPDGHDQALREQAVELISLSQLTLPHALARVVLAEQLYRASTILAGHPYHRD